MFLVNIIDGDASVYMALVKMTQEFSMRYPLIIGQGNFGSIDDISACSYEIYRGEDVKSRRVYA